MDVKDDAIKFWGEHRMEWVTTLHHLDKYGFSYLTGEECALMKRGLYDFNEIGLNRLQAWLGVGNGATFAKPRNSTVNGFPSVGSIMLEHKVVTHALIPFILSQTLGVGFIAYSTNSFFGEVGGMHRAAFDEALKRGFVVHTGVKPQDPAFGVLYVSEVYRVHELGPRVGPNNVHQMSGKAGGDE